MENKRKAKNNKKFLSILLSGLVFICVALLVAEITINTSVQLGANQSHESHSVVVDGLERNE